MFRTKVQKISWRQFQPFDTVADALTACHSWCFARVEIDKGVSVSVKPAVLSVSCSERGQENANHICYYKGYWSPAIEMAVLPHVIFFTNKSSIVFGGSRVCDDLFYGGDAAVDQNLCEKNADGRYLRQETLRDVESIANLDGNTLLIHPKFFNNYYHWHAEGLTQIKIAMDHIRLFDRIAVPPLRSFRKNILEFIPKSKLLELEEDKLYKFRCAAVLTCSFYSQAIHRDAGNVLRTVRDRLRNYVGVESKPENLIYLSRNASGSRPMLNELELASELTKLGVGVINSGRITWEDQVRIFSRARILIGPHGAGLTNLLYLPEGGQVIELRPLNSRMHGSPLGDRLYRNLSNIMNLDYGCIVCENEFMSDEWVADIGFIVHALQEKFTLKF